MQYGKLEEVTLGANHIDIQDQAFDCGNSKTAVASECIYML